MQSITGNFTLKRNEKLDKEIKEAIRKPARKHSQHQIMQSYHSNVLNGAVTHPLCKSLTWNDSSIAFRAKTCAVFFIRTFSYLLISAKIYGSGLKSCPWPLPRNRSSLDIGTICITRKEESPSSTVRFRNLFNSWFRPR